MKSNSASDTVPARIVIIGTSKMRLSERFNKLQKAPPPPPQPPKQPQRVSVRQDSVNGIAVGPIISRPRVVDDRDHPAAALSVRSQQSNNYNGSNRSFLHDDYMDNDLYGIVAEPFGRRSQMGGGGFRSNASYYDDYEPEPDPLKLSLEDYDHFSRVRTAQRRSIHSRISQTARTRFMHRNLPIYEEVDAEYYDDLGNESRTGFYNNPFYNRRPIHQRISFKATRLSDFDYLRRPLHRNTMMFKRPSYNRGFRFGSGRIGGGGSWGRRVGPFGRRDKRMKKSVAELDRELEEYMRSAKHPRVKPIK